MNLLPQSLLCVGLYAVLGLISCSAEHRLAPEFNGERALQYLVDQVGFGPRVPGTEASANCRAYFYDFFAGLNVAVDSQVFVYFDDYSGKNITMVNVIARCPAPTEGDNSALLLMAHYDSRPRTDHAVDTTLRDQPIDGANDGASGVAVLMEMANLLTTQAHPCTVDLVFVDGEDWGEEGDHDAYMIGSREFARSGIRDRYKLGIVVDLVGDSQQQLYREGFSERYAGSLNDAVWDAAARLGVTTFIDSVKHSVLDDHLSLNAAGVMAIDIIDFDYPHWHTEFDTPDKCSAGSLANVGQVIAEMIYNPSLWPKK